MYYQANVSSCITEEKWSCAGRESTPRYLELKAWNRNKASCFVELGVSEWASECAENHCETKCEEKSRNGVNVRTWTLAGCLNAVASCWGDAVRRNCGLQWRTSERWRVRSERERVMMICGSTAATINSCKSTSKLRRTRRRRWGRWLDDDNGSEVANGGLNVYEMIPMEMVIDKSDDCKSRFR